MSGVLVRAFAEGEALSSPRGVAPPSYHTWRRGRSLRVGCRWASAFFLRADGGFLARERAPEKNSFSQIGVFHRELQIFSACGMVEFFALRGVGFFSLCGRAVWWFSRAQEDTSLCIRAEILLACRGGDLSLGSRGMVLFACDVELLIVRALEGHLILDTTCASPSTPCGFRCNVRDVCFSCAATP